MSTTTVRKRRQQASLPQAVGFRPEAGDWGGMKFSQAVELYVKDMRRYGRINSVRTEHSYRHRLACLQEDVRNRDPRTVGRNDIKRSLSRWEQPNTQRNAHAIFISFFDWAMEEGVRKDNPARQVRKAKKRETSVYRLTREEVVALIDSCVTVRERRIIVLGVCVGVRNQELRGLRGEHFQRDGYVWVSPDIAKGKRERWVPVIPDAQQLVEEIRGTVALDEFVLPARRPSNPPWNTRWREYPSQPSSPQAIWRTVGDVAKRAGIAAHVHPHLLRHAYGDHVAKYAGLRAAQALLGHASVDTTASTYVDKPGLDELSVSVHGFEWRPTGETQTGGDGTLQIPLLAKDGSVVGYTQIDPQDHEWASRSRWRLSDKGYAVRGERIGGKPAIVFLHREVLELRHGDARQGDHINGDRLDNRRTNLRIVTNAENQQNRRGANDGSTSSYRGVSYRAREGKWRAQVRIGPRNHHVGWFLTEQEAAQAAADFRAEHMPFSSEGATAGYPPPEGPPFPVEATTGIEPVDRSNGTVEPNVDDRGEGEL